MIDTEKGRDLVSRLKQTTDELALWMPAIEGAFKRVTPQSAETATRSLNESLERLREIKHELSMLLD